MVVNVTLLIFLLIISNIFGDTNIHDDDYEKLPRIYHIDPYDKCVLEGKTFCRVSLQVAPLNPTNPSKTWRLIEDLKKSKWHYRHDKLYHALCIDNYYKNSSKTEAASVIISKLYTNSYSSMGLKAMVVDMDCNEITHHTGLFDVLFLTGLIAYGLLTIYATVYDMSSKTKQQKNLIFFSVRHNIVKFRDKYKEENFKKLRCIEGVRFYTSVLIIAGHTYCSFISGYVSNTEYVEKFYENFFKRTFLNLFVFLVQSFFLISAWLLSYRSFKFFSKAKTVDAFKFVCLTFCNRYLRIIPPIIVAVSTNSTKWIYTFFNGPLRKIYSDAEYQRCRNNWWTNILFINNLHFKQEETCYMISWYLSADIQLYLLTLILVVLIYRFKGNTNVIIGISILTGIVISSSVSYVYNVDFIFRLTPENSKNFFDLFEFFVNYTSPFTNMATYILGLTFGYIYFKFENNLIIINKFLVRYWRILFFGLPLTVIIIPCYEYNRETSAILAGILKPLYTLGIGIGIFMMSQQKEGLLKKVFESKIIFFLGNITYTTYLSQFAIVFSRLAQASQPRYVSDFILFSYSIRDIVLSFICGFIMHILLELPMLQLQELYIPKYRISEKKYKKKN